MNITTLQVKRLVDELSRYIIDDEFTISQEEFDLFIEKNKGIIERYDFEDDYLDIELNDEITIIVLYSDEMGVSVRAEIY